MGIGILGGTFDPIHRGHVALGLAALDALALSQVRVIPAGVPPWKPDTTGAAHRMAMVRLACAGTPLIPDDRELQKQAISHSVDTVADLRQQFPDQTLWFVVGQDVLPTLHQWHDWPRLCTLCNFAVGLRPGTDTTDAMQAALRLQTNFGATIKLLPFTGPELSATALRSQAADKQWQVVEQGVGPEVAAYIRQHGLYKHE